METPHQTLALTIHFMDGRYHGEPEWPPSPARLFQAIVAGSNSLQADALLWLEGLPPPLIVAPTATRGQKVLYYVPNNDLDGEKAKGLPSSIDKLRVEKVSHPRLFDASIPLVYAWELNSGNIEHADRVIELASNLYQLGRGIDMAWATATLLDSEKLDEQLSAHPGRILRPTRGGKAGGLLCPRPGSLNSLIRRHKQTLERFSLKGKKRVFRQPSKPLFVSVAYDATAQRQLFDLRNSSQTSFSAVSQLHITALTESLRDAAAARLLSAVPERESEIDRWLIGRTSRAPRAPSSERVRLILLPSIGHEHVDPQIRRLLVEVPANCRLSARDVFWAFSGLSFQNGAETDAILITSNESRMLTHYGINAKPCRFWQTVTPAALPLQAARRRIPPNRTQEDAKAGRERSEEEAAARAAVRESLRHSGVDSRPDHIWVQREPFSTKGERAEAFARGTRFAKEQLWHIEIGFRESIAGPIILGNGRFLGLGIMSPKRVVKQPTVARYAVISKLAPPLTKGVHFAEVVRRSLLKLSDGHLVFRGRDQASNEPAQGHGHAFVLPEANDKTGRITHVCIVAKSGFDETAVDALHALRRLFAGQAFEAHVSLIGIGIAEDFVSNGVGGASLLSTSCIWESRTPFVSTRHAKWQGRDSEGRRMRKNDSDGRQIGSAEHDLCRLLTLKGLPKPIRIRAIASTMLRGQTEWRHFERWRKRGGGRNAGHQGHGFEIEFAKPVTGPIVVGYGAHFGLGAFLPKGSVE